MILIKGKDGQGRFIVKPGETGPQHTSSVTNMLGGDASGGGRGPIKTSDTQTDLQAVSLPKEQSGSVGPSATTLAGSKKPTGGAKKSA
jgi:hypothetical protein